MRNALCSFSPACRTLSTVQRDHRAGSPLKSVKALLQHFIADWFVSVLESFAEIPVIFSKFSWALGFIFWSAQDNLNNISMQHFPSTEDISFFPLFFHFSPTSSEQHAQCVTLDINTWTRLGIIFYAVHEIWGIPMILNMYWYGYREISLFGQESRWLFDT